MRKPSTPLLEDGTYSYDQSVRPLQRGGFCTYQAMLSFLGTHERLLNQHMKALGIFLEPFVRKESWGTKVYKKKRRPFTEDEARRIIERHRGLQGREE